MTSRKRRYYLTGAVTVIALLVIVLLVSGAHAGETDVFFREDFETLEDWEPVFFPSIKEHTEYRIERNGEESWLLAKSDGSASGLVFRHVFNVYEYGKVRWRWKISNIYQKGNATTKEGDDYPIRVYIMFQYDPDRASFSKRVKYGFAKMLYGEYPPESTLNYIWANRDHGVESLTSTYAESAKLIPLETGGEKAGTWQTEEVNVLEDYRRIFGKEPPGMARIAVMNDADNTGESSVSSIDFIEVSKP